MKERHQFQRVEVTRDEALAMFQENPFKIEILSGLPQEATITLYRRVLQALGCFLAVAIVDQLGAAAATAVPAHDSVERASLCSAVGLCESVLALS